MFGPAAATIRGRVTLRVKVRRRERTPPPSLHLKEVSNNDSIQLSGFKVEERRKKNTNCWRDGGMKRCELTGERGQQVRLRAQRKT